MAIADLHERLRREAAFHIRRRARHLPAFPASDVDDLAVQAADDALVAVLRKLDGYRGESRFLTWARRFAELEAPVSIRRRLGRAPTGPALDPESVLSIADPGRSAQDRAETRELIDAVSGLMATELTHRQRTVLTEVAINGVSTDALAEALETTPGAIYKSLYDARAKLRLHLA